MMNRNDRIYVAGHTGLVGSAIMRRLHVEGCSELISGTHSELDLSSQSAVDAFFSATRPDYVFLAAARVGGIQANSNFPAEFIYSNLSIQTNVIHATWKNNVKKTIVSWLIMYISKTRPTTYQRRLSAYRTA